MESLAFLIIMIVIGVISAKIGPAAMKQQNAANRRGTPGPTGPDAATALKQPTPAPPVPHAPPEPAPAVLDSSDIMPASVADGDSRECDHGSVGGSMDITTHEGTGDTFEHAKQKVTTQVKTQVRTQVATQVKVNVDTPEQAGPAAPVRPAAPAARWDRARMREAVVMAEILKRPSQRGFGRRGAAR